MSSVTDRTAHTALIPWIIVLVAFFGMNAHAPDHSSSKSRGASDEIGLTQLVQHAPSTGRIFNPQIFLEPVIFDRFGCLNPCSLFLRVESHADLPAVSSLGGRMQGRAPPATSLS